MKLHGIFLAGLLAISGCASAPPPAPFAVAAPEAALPPPPAGMAQIVFVMPKNLFVDTAYVGLYDIHGPENTLMAMVPSHGKTVQLVTPGHHQFFSAFGAQNHLMDADVVAGKRYYVLMRFIYAGGFQLRPIRTSGPSDYSAKNKDFASWVSSTHFVDKTAEADAWYANHRQYVNEALAAAQVVWGKKSAEQHAELTLNANDAFLE